MTILNVTNYHRKVLSTVTEIDEFLDKYQEMNVYNQNQKRKKLKGLIMELQLVALNDDDEFDAKMKIADDDEDFAKIDLERHIMLGNTAIIKYWKKVFRIANTDELFAKWKDVRVRLDLGEYKRLHPLVKPELVEGVGGSEVNED